MVELPEPRPLDGIDRALLDFILSGPNVRDELRTQADSARVVMTCECGCRSVGVEPDPAAPRAPYTPEDSPEGSDHYIRLSAEGSSSAGTCVEVTLHVMFGRLTELEIWDGAFTQGKSRGELPELSTLKHWES